MKKLIIAMGLAVLTAGSASANTAYLQISDNNGNSTALMTSGTGVITYNNTLGNWDLNIDTGIANPPAGINPPTQPDIDLNFDNRFKGGAGNVLTITFYADGLGPINAFINQVFGGTLAKGMTDRADLMINGVSVGHQTFSNGTTSAQAFAFNNDFAVNAAANSTVGITLTITAPTTGSSLTSGDANAVTVPDAGMTLALLGSALTGLALFARSRKTA